MIFLRSKEYVVKVYRKNILGKQEILPLVKYELLHSGRVQDARVQFPEASQVDTGLPDIT